MQILLQHFLRFYRYSHPLSLKTSTRWKGIQTQQRFLSKSEQKIGGSLRF